MSTAESGTAKVVVDSSKRDNMTLMSAKPDDISQQHHQQQKQKQQDQQKLQPSEERNCRPPAQHLIDENRRLHEQIVELQRQLNIVQQQNAEMAASNTYRKKHKKRKQNHSWKQSTAYGPYQCPPRFPSNVNRGGPVLLELPVAFRNKDGNSNNARHLLCWGSRSRSQKVGGRNVPKDHQSVTANDDQDTIEPTPDLESHQSAPGLHHRYAINPSSGMTAYTAGTTTLTSYNHSLSILQNDSNKSLEESISSDEYDHHHHVVVVDDDNDDDDDEEEDDDDVHVSLPLIGGPCIESGSAGLDGRTRSRAGVNATASRTNNEASRGHFQTSFIRSAADRAGWLVALLVFQSLSSFILARNERLLQRHAVIVQFLTMLVGAGGNAGNQASVGVIRGIAVGTIDRSNVGRVLQREFLMGLTLSVILGVAGFIRAAVFAIPMLETFAITSSLFMIVIISVVVGSALPLGMQMIGVDPAHSSTTIQVIMDITGVVITVQVSSIVLDTRFYENMITMLSMDGETR